MYKRTNITKSRDFFKKAVTNIRRATSVSYTHLRYKPASPEEPLDERFVEALHMTETVEHLTDCVAFGTPQQKADAAAQLLSGSYLLMLEERTDRLALAKCA